MVKSRTEIFGIELYRVVWSGTELYILVRSRTEIYGIVRYKPAISSMTHASEPHSERV